jgi:PAS domain S-box-containing protein
MRTARRLWSSLTTPLATNEDEARREHMTRVIYTLVSAGFVLMSLIVPIFDVTAGTFSHRATLYILAVDGLLAGGWAQICKGRWRISRYLLPGIFLALSAYTILQFGLVTPAVLHLVIVVVLTSMLFGARAQWIIVTACELLYLTSMWLAGERHMEGLLIGGIAIGFTLSGVATLLWYASTLLDKSLERLRRAEAASRESAEKIRAIFESITDGITMTDLTGRITGLNEATVRMHGFESRDQLIGSNAFDLLVKADQAKARGNMQSILSGSRGDRQERRLIRRDGSEFDAELNAILIRKDKDQPVGFVILTRDITPRKQAEVEREQLIRELEEKNGELESFTYTVSHDLKAPLVTISGFLGYLQQDIAAGNAEKMRADIQHIDRAVNKMQRLLDELLELSRIGRLVNRSETVSFEGVAHEALELVRGRLEACRVGVRMQPHLPPIYGDRQRLVQVVQNLLDNAAKFMGNQPEPCVEIGQRGEEEGRPIFFVRDNGMGIAPEYHERIFGLFNKLSANTEGTGTGLAIVRRIIEVHGGRIWVESQEGKGSTFYFTVGNKK